MAEVHRKSRAKKVKAGTNRPLFRRSSDSAPGTSQWFVLSSNFTVGPLLARGCLLPDALEGDAVFASGARVRLLRSTGPFPVEWVDTLVASARNVIPIAIRLSPGREARRVNIPGYPHSTECVCLSDVSGLCFRTEKELARFESLEFGNYDLATTGVQVGVDATLFDGSPEPVNESAQGVPSPRVDIPATPDAQVLPPEPVPTREAADIVRTADCRSGLLAFLLTGSPGKRVWMQGVQALFATRPKGTAPRSWPEYIAGSALGIPIHAAAVDQALLSAVIDVLRNYPIENGWPAHQVLAEVTDAARIRAASREERVLRDLAIWSERAGSVLASRAEPQSLADDAFVLQRAVLLLLLRGDLVGVDEDDAAQKGPLRPGPQVLGAAGALAAFRTGLRAMPARYKAASDPQASSRLLAYLGEVFVSMLQGGGQSSLVPSSLPSPVINYRSIRTLQGEWITTVESREVARIIANFDGGLERVLTMGRHLGFELEERGSEGLVTHVRQPDGRTQPVYLDLLYSERVGHAVVRFSAPTLKLVGMSSRSRLPKEFLLDLLMRNSDPDMNCRFAIVDEDSVIVVLVDQLLGTLDEAELKGHIHHVARVAAEFELTRGIGKLTTS